MNTKNAYVINNEYKTLVGYDCSYSTSLSCNGSDTSFYHSQTQKLVKDLDSSNTLFVRWDSDITIISKIDLEVINKNKQGFGGTSPVSLFKYISHTGFNGNLIFISDGRISDSCAQQCTEILSGCKFKNVYIHLIYTGGNINESVSCALTRGSPHEINIYKESYTSPETITVTDHDFNSAHNIDSITTIDEFLNQKETLKNVLVSINIGTIGNKILHQKLVTLKNRLVKSESKKFVATIDSPISRLVDSFKLSEPSITELDNVWKLYHKIEDDIVEDGNDWKKIIDRFISWCSGSLLTVYDRNKLSNREAKSIVQPVIPSENVAIIEETPTDIKLTCPITLSESSNMIILKKRNGSSIFADLPTNIRDSLINCPLNALRNHDILMYIKSLLDCVISIEAYKDLIDYGISDKSPLTRNEIFGGLCIGKDNSHVQATNSTLRHVLTGGKSLGNMDLWFAVIYFIVERGHAEHLKDYLPMIKEHLQYRLLNSKSYMCLSGLSTYPVYSVPLGLAMWCSVMATTSKLSLIKDPKNDPLRLHMSYAFDIIELLNIINISVPDKLNEHINRLKTFRNFLLEVKKGKDQCAKLKNSINAFFYNAIENTDMWVLIDGEPLDMQISKVRSQLPSVCKDLSITEINDIIDLCNANKAEADIYIPYNYEVKPYVKKTTKNWKFATDIPYYKVDISPKTCRPYYSITDNGEKKTWLDNATKVYGTELFSTNNFFGNYIFQNKKYPTKHEFLNYLFMYHFTREKKTLPICIEQFVDEVFLDYKEIVDNINPEEFARRWENSVHISVRESME